MSEASYNKTKKSVLLHVQALFDEMEKEMAISHQEKYALLEDLFENASDKDELKVAFEQWYADHCDDVPFEHEVDDLWDQALGGEIDNDDYSDDDKNNFDDDDGNEDDSDGQKL